MNHLSQGFGNVNVDEELHIANLREQIQENFQKYKSFVREHFTSTLLNNNEFLMERRLIALHLNPQQEPAP